MDVFSAGDVGDVPCFRIPALLYDQDGSLLAFAEARSWLGDNCWPAKGATMRRDNATSIVLRRSTSQGECSAQYGLAKYADLGQHDCGGRWGWPSHSFSSVAPLVIVATCRASLAARPPS